MAGAIVLERPKERVVELDPVEAIVRSVIALCYTSRVSYTPAAERVLSENPPSSEVMERLAVVGLAKLASDVSHQYGGHADPNVRARFMGNFHVRRHGGRQVPSVLDKPYIEFGVWKPLREFALEDLDGLLNNAHAKAKGWEAVAKWARKAKDLLAKHKAETVEALPDRAFRELEEAWPR